MSSILHNVTQVLCATKLPSIVMAELSKRTEYKLPNFVKQDSEKLAIYQRNPNLIDDVYSILTDLVKSQVEKTPKRYLTAIVFPNSPALYYPLSKALGVKFSVKIRNVADDLPHTVNVEDKSNSSTLFFPVTNALPVVKVNYTESLYNNALSSPIDFKVNVNAIIKSLKEKYLDSHNYIKFIDEDVAQQLYLETIDFAVENQISLISNHSEKLTEALEINYTSGSKVKDALARNIAIISFVKPAINKYFVATCESYASRATAAI